MGLLKKKNKDDGEESSRLALFGSRSRDKSPAPPSHNPYAQPNVPPDPYTQAKMNAGIIPPSQPPSGGPAPGGYGRPPQQQYGQNPYPNQPPPGQQEPSSYGASRFGNNQGYGAASQGGNPYATTNQLPGTARTGGYGGLGPAVDDYGADSNRDALFGGAKERIEQKQHNAPPGYGYNDPSGAQQDDSSYGAYGDRQLTAEEEEEEDVAATKQDIKFMKQQDVASTRNALQAAAMAEETGRNTLARLGAQGERIHKTDQNLDIGHNAINLAEDKSKELKKLNRSMFAVHINMNSKQKIADREEKIMQDHQTRRDVREGTRKAAFDSNQRMNQNFKNLNSQGKPNMPKASLAERGKYQFEADSDDDRMEDEIERNIDDISAATSRLNVLARAMGEEADAQNAHLLKIQDKSDKLDDRFHLQTERLRRIR